MEATTSERTALTLATAPEMAQEFVRAAIETVRDAGFGDVVGWLRGDPLGYPMHPVLVDGAGGFWTASLSLDVLAALGFRSFGRAADAMLALGLISAAPTIAAGAAEFAELPGRSRDRGFAHALMGISATLLYTGSLVLRLAGKRHKAFFLSAAASGIAIAGAHKGGQLVFEDGAGQSPRPPRG